MTTDGARGSVDELIEQMTNGDEAARERIFDRLLEMIADEHGEDLAALARALTHSDVVVRQAASAALAGAGEVVAAVEDPLTRALRDSDPIVRGNAALALGGLGTRAYGALEDLHDALGMEEDHWASAVIAKVIQDISPEE